MLDASRAHIYQYSNEIFIIISYGIAIKLRENGSNMIALLVFAVLIYIRARRCVCLELINLIRCWRVDFETAGRWFLWRFS